MHQFDAAVIPVHVVVFAGGRVQGGDLVDLVAADRVGQ